MDDIKTVQTAVASQGTTTTAGTTPTQEPAKQPSQEEIIGALIAKAFEVELPKQMAKVMEPLKREFQSTKDKSIAEVDRASKQAQEMYNSMMQAASGDDPEVRERLQQAGTMAQQRIAQQQAYEEMSRRKQKEFDTSFKDAHTQFVKELGIDPDDKAIDWGEGEGDYLEKTKAIQKSIAKIIKAKSKEDNDKVKKQLVDVNSVDTSTPSNVSSSGIPTDMVRFRQWIADHPDEYRKNKVKANEMLKNGLIK